MMRKLALGTILLCFTGLVTLILDSVLRLNVLPSPDWAGGMGWPVFLASLVPGGIATRVLLKHDAATRPPAKTRKKAGEEVLLALGLPIFIACGLTLFVFNTAPAAHALLVRDTVTHVHVAARGTPGGTRHCRSALRLERMPFMQDAICRMPRDFFEDLDTGDRVAVTGLGSRLGLYPRTVRILGP